MAFLEVFLQMSLKFHTLWDSAGWEASYSKTTGVSTPTDHLDVQTFEQLDIQRNRNKPLLWQPKKSFNHLWNCVNTHFHLDFPFSEESDSSFDSRCHDVEREVMQHFSLTLNGIRKSCKQLVLKDCQCLSCEPEWSQQALGCSGKGSIQIWHWKAVAIV